MDEQRKIQGSNIPEIAMPLLEILGILGIR